MVLRHPSQVVLDKIPFSSPLLLCHLERVVFIINGTVLSLRYKVHTHCTKHEDV